MSVQSVSRGRFVAAFFVALSVFLSESLTGQSPRPAGGASAPVIAIRGATVITVTRGVIPNGTVLIRDGRIAAVGTAVEIPAGAEIVDASGRFVTPGLIDAHSHIAADSINESGTTVSSMTGIEDVLNPGDINIYRDLAGGLTTANVLHGSANPIGGKNAVIKLRYGKPSARELLFEGAMPGIKFALGENPKDLRTSGSARGPLRYPVTRAGVEFVIRDAFSRAKAYQKSWHEYERRKRAGEDVIAPRRDLQLEPLVEVLEGKRLVHAHCYRADEILMLIRLAEETGFKIATFQHVLEGYKVAKEIAAHGAGASTFSDWWGYKIEAIDAIPHNAALMLRRGVLVTINSDSAEHARRLNTEAAKSIKWGGLSDDEALALVTINAAKQLKIEHRVGSLEPGKDGDVAIWTAHPLSSYAIVDRTYIDGQLYYDRLADERRITSIKQEKAALVAAEKAERKTSGTAGASQDKPAEPVRADTASATGSSRSVMATNQVGGAQHSTAVFGKVGAAPSGSLAIINARITPVAHPVIERGTVLVRDGNIAAVGANVTVPPGATIIDAAGHDVYPGWINARATIGLAEPGAAGFQDTAEMLEFNPQLRTVASFNSDSETIPIARANGITTAAVMPTGGMLSGQVPVMNLDGWTWEENAVAHNVGIALQFPALTPPATAGGAAATSTQPQTFEDLKKARDAKLDRLSRLLDQAQAYVKAGSGRQTDWVLDALAPVVERRLPFIVRADRESDIRDAIAFAEKEGVRIVLSGGPEVALVAPLLKDKGIAVIFGPVLALPPREDMSHAASYQAAAELARAGVKFAFATGDATNVRLLPYQAAESVAWGLPREQAIRALTLDAAEILGISDRLGSLEPGKIANLLIAKGDPLEIRTQVSHIIINGRSVPLSNRHLELYERYSKRP